MSTTNIMTMTSVGEATSSSETTHEIMPTTNEHSSLSTGVSATTSHSPTSENTISTTNPTDEGVSPAARPAAPTFQLTDENENDDRD